MNCDISIGLRFSVLSRSFRCKIDEMLREHDITGPQLGVLNALRNYELTGREVCQRDLENASHVTHPTMTEMIKRLEKKGLLVTRQSENDRRSKSIFLTDQGRDILRRTNEVERGVSDALSVGLSEEQLKQLDEITSIMMKNLKCTKGCE